MENEFAIAPPETWRTWLRRKLFPYKHCFAPEAPSDYKDCINIHTVCEISLVDRIRLLLTGRIEVTTRTITQNEIGNCITSSKAVVMPPLWL